MLTESTSASTPVPPTLGAMSEAEPKPQSSLPARPAATGPLSLRISDAERHQVAELLRDAAADGRLSMDELDERLETVYRSKTYAELVPVAADLPGARDRLPMAASAELAGQAASSRAPARSLGRAGSHTSSGAVAIFGGADRSGVWTVGDKFTALAVMGGISLDFREAVFTAAETTVYANCLMGGVDITVPDDIIVRVAGVPFMGGFDGPKGGTNRELPADAPVLLIKGVAIMGGVDVKVKARKAKGAAADDD
jgi:Domain of unknown function (DUF1707)/Cell wall-active antibiotics response 4TMS YvqF